MQKEMLLRRRFPKRTQKHYGSVPQRGVLDSMIKQLASGRNLKTANNDSLTKIHNTVKMIRERRERVKAALK